MTKSHTCNTIPSIPRSDLPSAPVTWMPFGKRLLTSAIEGEFKQSYVIFYIVHHLNHNYEYLACSLYTCIFILHSSHFLL